MDIVKNSSTKMNHDLILEPKDGASLTLTKEQLLLDSAQTLENFAGTTIDNFTHTAKSSNKGPSVLHQ